MHVTIEPEEEPSVKEAKDSEDIEDDSEVEELEDNEVEKLEELNADLQNDSGNFDHQSCLTYACLLLWSCFYSFMYWLRGSECPCHFCCPWDGYAGFDTVSLAIRR